MKDVSQLRKEYSSRPLLAEDAPENPIDLFASWFNEAREADVEEPNGMTLATATPEGRPHARIVLLKGYDARGFVFYTNYESAKGRQLLANPQAALTFWWAELARQVRIEGEVSKVTEQESEEYFATRPRGSRIGAWASPQSQVIPDRSVLDNAAEQYDEEFGEDIPKPENWGGFRLDPSLIEFWHGRESRLHDRLLYQRSESGEWQLSRLAP